MTTQEAFKHIGMSEKDFPRVNSKMLDEIVATVTEHQKKFSYDPAERKTAEAWQIFQTEYYKWKGEA